MQTGCKVLGCDGHCAAGVAAAAEEVLYQAVVNEYFPGIPFTYAEYKAWETSASDEIKRGQTQTMLMWLFLAIKYDPYGEDY